MIEFNATFIVSMISFVIFIFIMNMIFYKPILNMIKNREDYINKNYDTAKDFSSKTELCKAEIASAVENEIMKSQDEANLAINKAKKNALDKINTNRVAANKKIQAYKAELSEEVTELKRVLSEEYIGDLTETLSDKLLKGKV